MGKKTYRNFGINENIGNEEFPGETPLKDSALMQQFWSDNFELKEGIVTEVFMGSYVAQVNCSGANNYAFWLTKLLGSPIRAIL